MPEKCCDEISPSSQELIFPNELQVIFSIQYVTNLIKKLELSNCIRAAVLYHFVVLCKRLLTLSLPVYHFRQWER